MKGHLFFFSFFPYFLLLLFFFVEKLNYTPTLRPECQIERTLVSTHASVEVYDGDTFDC